MGLRNRADIAVLKDLSLGFRYFLDDNFNHDAGQIVGWNDLIGEQQPERGLNGAQKPVAEIGFLPWLHRIDIRRSEEIDLGEPGI